MDGILNVNKPAGPTSYDVVAMVKRLSGERRVGHAGTLDPAASGVLPVCLGYATRVVEFLMDATKVYRAEIELGVSTDTYDATGQVTASRDPGATTRQHIELVLAGFTGDIMQTPPMFSALKHEGKPLYRLARAGIEVARKSRPVRIRRLDLIDWRLPYLTIEVECGKGTYIRSLAQDIGEALGCGGHLRELVRLKSGVFDIREALSLPDLERALRDGHWTSFVYPADHVLAHWRAVVVDDAGRQKIRQGVLLELDIKEPDTGQPYCRAYGLDGNLLGLLRFDPESRRWHPQKVFI